MARRIPAIVLAVCAACGGGNQTFATGSASVSGTIGGQTMTPKDAAEAAKTFKPRILVPYHQGTSNPQEVVGALADFKGIEVRVVHLP